MVVTAIEEFNDSIKKQLHYKAIIEGNILIWLLSCLIVLANVAY